MQPIAQLRFTCCGGFRIGQRAVEGVMVSSVMLITSSGVGLILLMWTPVS